VVTTTATTISNPELLSTADSSMLELKILTNPAVLIEEVKLLPELIAI